jgi:MFS superfamily sulfate permease-like transporter
VVGRASHPLSAVLSESPDGSGFYPNVQQPPTETLKGLIIYRFNSSLYFANAGAFGDEVEQLVEAATTNGGKLEWFVLDASAINDIDTTGAGAIERVLDLLEKHGVTFAISHANPRVPGLLMTYELLDKIGETHLYRTNRDAVAAFAQASATLC